VATEEVARAQAGKILRAINTEESKQRTR